LAHLVVKPAAMLAPFLGGSCPDDWHYYNGKCFYTSDRKVDQPTARRKCRANGAELASISNQEEMDFVKNIS